MNAKWTTTVAAGAIAIILSGQAMAQPGGGRGRGQGFGRGQGMNSRWAQGPAGGRRMAEPNGSAAVCPFGFAPGGRGAWNAPGLGQSPLGRQFANRLGLSEDQVQKIRKIVDNARQRTVAAIREVLTEEQAGRFDRMCANAGQGPRGGRGPGMQNGLAGPGGRRFQQDQDRGPRMGRGPRGNQGPGAVMTPPAGRQGNRPGPAIEDRFDEMDANHDGALTREEIRTYRQKMAPGLGPQRP